MKASLLNLVRLARLLLEELNAATGAFGDKGAGGGDSDHSSRRCSASEEGSSTAHSFFTKLENILVVLVAGSSSRK